MVSKVRKHASEGREFFQLLSTGKYEDRFTTSCQIIHRTVEKYSLERVVLLFFTVQQIQKYSVIPHTKHLHIVLLADLFSFCFVFFLFFVLGFEHRAFVLNYFPSPSYFSF